MHVEVRFKRLTCPPMPRKIVVIGPESTGKSTLCRQLAQHYDTLWCPEYAREYLIAHGAKYTYDDLLIIAKGQIELEDDYTQRVINAQNRVKDNSPALTHDRPGVQPRLLFIDTDMYVMKVWCEFVFGKCHPYILEQIAKRQYDLYLLCNIDLEWTFDELREYPDLRRRQSLYAIYKQILLNQQTPWLEISGNYDERFQKAVQGVSDLLKQY